MPVLLQGQSAHPMLFFMVDSTTKEPAIGLTCTVSLSKNGGAGSAAAGAVSQVDSSSHPGLYKVAANATDCNTLGDLALSATASGAEQPGGQPMLYQIVAYDPDTVAVGALMPATAGRTLVVDASGLADANTVKIGPTGSGTAQTARDVGASFPANFADLAITATTGRVDVASIAINAITTSSFAAGAINATAIGSDAITSAKIAAGAITAAAFNPGAIDATAIADNAITAAKIATDAGVEIAIAVWEETTTGHMTATGSFGKFFGDQLDAAVSSRSTYAGADTSGTTTLLARVPTFPTNFASLLINSSGHISRVTLADTVTTYTNNTPQSGDAFGRIGATGSGLTSLAPSSTALSTAVWTGAKAGFIDAAISGVSTGGVSAGDIADAVWDETTSGHTTSGTFAKFLADQLNATVASRMATFSYTAPDNSGILAAISTLSTHGDSAWATATGFSTLTAAGVRAAVGQASANLDTQLAAILAASGGSAPSAATIATTVWANVTRTLTALPSPAPTGYGGTFSGDISGLTDEQAAQLTSIATACAATPITVTQPVSTSGAITIYRGDDYYYADGRAFIFTSAAWPVLTSGTVLFKTSALTYAMTISAAREVRLQLTSAQTAIIAKGRYEIEATLASGHVVTLGTGAITAHSQLAT